MTETSTGELSSSELPNPVGGLSHVRQDGTAHMVDVSGKQATVREAIAEATLVTTRDVVALITDHGLPKGDALAVARVAGIMAAKQTSSLIPLCHPLPLSKVTVDFEADLELGDGAAGHGTGRVRVVALVRTTALTGVEMEALTSASVAALTLYDMVKAVDKRAVITDIRVVSKTGGKSGDWTA